MLSTIHFQTLDDLYRYYNVKLFDGALPECIINLSRRPNTYGFLAPNLWVSTDKKSPEQSKRVHEISLNPDHLTRPTINWHSTLVHEMAHLWQHEQGTPSRKCYHNREWAEKMIELGLMPTNTGAPGGKITGQSMTHYVITDGRFEKVFNLLDPKELEWLRLKYLPVTSLSSGINKKTDDPDDGDGGDGSKKKPKAGVRYKYTCNCGNNIWGKSGLKIECLDCGSEYTEE